MKHAYLIMAHNEMGLLKLLLSKLDHKDNTIYLHCDVKFDCDMDALRAQLNTSTLHFIKRMDVRWGKYSQIQCELELLKEAVKGNHDYYHLITGVDLPLKSNEEINAFFEEHNGQEFVSYDKNANETRNFINRFDKWHFKLVCKYNNALQRAVVSLCNIPLQIFEKVANTVAGNRSRKYADLVFMKGSSYFDITHALATYVVEKEELIREIFKFSHCCDEVFLHTIAYNSPFVDKITYYGTRYIDWSKHGKSPEILTLNHWEDMESSGKLFARKFSSGASGDLIKKLYGAEALASITKT